MYNQKGFNDFEQYRSLKNGVYRMMPGKEGVIISFMMDIFNFILNVGALPIKTFLRTKIGGRSFGIITIICSLGWLQLLLHNNKLIPADEVPQDIVDSITKKTSLLHQQFTPLVNITDSLFTSPIHNFKANILGMSLKSNESILLFCFIIGFILLSINHYINGLKRQIQKEKWHSYHPGKSFFLGFLNGRKYFGFYFSETVIRLIIEPLLTIILALIIDLHLHDYVMATMLTTSAVCLLIQEFMIYKKRQNMVQDLIDQEVEFHEITEELKKFKQSNLANSETLSNQKEYDLVVEP